MKPLDLKLNAAARERLRQLYATGAYEQFNHSLAWEGYNLGMAIQEISERLQEIKNSAAILQAQAQEDTAAFLQETCTARAELEAPGGNDKNLRYIAQHLMPAQTWPSVRLAQCMEADLEVFHLLSNRYATGARYYLEHENLSGTPDANLDNFMFFVSHAELATQLISMYGQSLDLEVKPSGAERP